MLGDHHLISVNPFVRVAAVTAKKTPQAALLYACCATEAEKNGQELFTSRRKNKSIIRQKTTVDGFNHSENHSHNHHSR